MKRLQNSECCGTPASVNGGLVMVAKHAEDLRRKYTWTVFCSDQWSYHSCSIAGMTMNTVAFIAAVPVAPLMMITEYCLS